MASTPPAPGRLAEHREAARQHEPGGAQRVGRVGLTRRRRLDAAMQARSMIVLTERQHCTSGQDERWALQREQQRRQRGDRRACRRSRTSSTHTLATVNSRADRTMAGSRTPQIGPRNVNAPRGDGADSRRRPPRVPRRTRRSTPVPSATACTANAQRRTWSGRRRVPLRPRLRRGDRRRQQEGDRCRSCGARSALVEGVDEGADEERPFGHDCEEVLRR